jgi:uncharacterized Zn finger protein
VTDRTDGSGRTGRTGRNGRNGKTGSGRLGRPHPEWGDNVIEGDFGAASRRRAGRRRAERDRQEAEQQQQASRQVASRTRRRETRRSEASGKEGWAAELVLQSVSAGADTGRMSRGLTYYRDGAVFQLSAELGRVNALVRGSQLEPFEVQMRWRPLSPHQVSYVTGEITEHPDNLRLLLAGRAPQDAVSAVLFRESDFMDSWCTCPDHGVVCKHRIAVAHELGACFTRDPAEFLSWRGLDPEALIAATTAGPAATDAGQGSGAGGVGGAGEDTAAGDAAPVPDRRYTPTEFWGDPDRIPQWDPLVPEPGLDLGDRSARDTAVRAVSWNTVDQLNVLSQLEDCYDIFTGRDGNGDSDRDGDGPTVSDGHDRSDRHD